MKRAKKKPINKIKLLIAVGAAVWACVTFVQQQSLLNAQYDKKEALTQKKEELSKQIDYYENELEYIGTDEYIEKQARERLGWLKPGDRKFVEHQGAKPSVDDAQSEESAQPPQSGEESGGSAQSDGETDNPEP